MTENELIEKYIEKLKYKLTFYHIKTTFNELKSSGMFGNKENQIGFKDGYFEGFNDGIEEALMCFEEVVNKWKS